MSRHVLVALAVAAMLVLAGCGSQGGEQTRSPTELLETESPTQEGAATPTVTPTATPTRAPTPTATPEPSPTASATPTATTTADSGSIPTTEAAYPERLETWTEITERHESEFATLDSFTAVYDVSVGGPDAARESGERLENRSIHLKNGTEAAWISIENPERTVTAYKNSTDARMLYGRLNESGNVSYVQEAGDIPQYQFRDIREPSFFSKFNFTERGVTDTEHGEREVYTVSGVENVDTRSIGVEDATEISLTVHVDPDSGVITLFDYSATLERPEGTLTVSQEVRITDIGSTTVDAPEWVDEAKESDR